MRPFHAYLFSR